MWKEELVDFHLFTKPKAQDDDEEDGQSEPEVGEADAGAFVGGGRPLAVQEGQVRSVDQLLSAEVYSQRWPKIPKRELWGTSVKHPFLPEAWWLADTKVLSSILNPDRTVKLDAAGKAPPVKACRVCAWDLTGSRVKMPVFALANDNLLLRQPCVFSDEFGNPLSDGTLLLLALARAVVVKEVAEPLRQGAREEQQQVLKGNTIALPQADCRVLATEKLPADLSILRPFLRDHLAVVFCGKDVSQVNRYPKLEVNWRRYVEAVRFLVAHNPDYANVQVDEEAAKVMFGDLGIPAVIKELITGLDVDEGFTEPSGAAVEARLPTVM